ncbi:MAG TPA: anti-sigma factor [Moraxellaceae bacterium]
MKYDHPELQHRLAAEYVLGTLHGPARLRFEKLLAHDPGLRRKVAAWEQRLSPWAQAVKPVPVPGHVWTQLQHRLFPARPGAAGSRAPRFWLGLAWGGTALAAVLALVLVMRPAPPVPPAPPVLQELAVLAPDKAEAMWIVRRHADGSALELSHIGAVKLPPGRDLELWAIPAQGGPRSLGVITMHDDRHARMVLDAARSKLLAEGVALAVSLEPSGGSPTGAPTGPVLCSGKLLPT